MKSKEKSYKRGGEEVEKIALNCSVDIFLLFARWLKKRSKWERGDPIELNEYRRKRGEVK